MVRNKTTGAEEASAVKPGTLSHALLLLCGAAGILGGQTWNPGQEMNAALKEATGARLQISLEERMRYEGRSGNNFGNSPSLENPLIRTRIGASFLVTDWLKVSAMGQDARAPDYGGPAPNSARDSMDLHEGYIELFPDNKAFFGAIFGRQMVSYGEGRLIGVPQWSNTSRTFDTARFHFLFPLARIEFLMVSPVKVLPDEFNRPELGDRVVGTYDSFPKLLHRGVVEAYFLRHDQNRPGGFTQPGSLGTNSFGARAAGPTGLGLKYRLEAVAQTGHTGALTHRGHAWFSNVSRTVHIRRPLDLSVEYKYASGNSAEDKSRETTFDQLSPANHDTFGHEDLFGWRNMKN